MKASFFALAGLLLMTVGCQSGTSVVVRDPYYQSAYAGTDGDRFVALPFKRTVFAPEVELDPDSCVECSVMSGGELGADGVSSLAFNLPFRFTNRSTQPWIITRGMFSLRRDDGEEAGTDPFSAPPSEDTILLRVPPGSTGTLPMRFLLTNFVVEEDAFGEYLVTFTDESGTPLLEEKLLIKAYRPALQVARFTGVVLLLIGLGAIA